MKHLFFVILIFAVSSVVNAQDSPLLTDGKLNIDSFYKDKSELLIHSEIIQIDSLKKEDLIRKVKNWASTSFVNLKEVLVSETDDQIVLNYITTSYYIKSLGLKSNWGWYIRLVIQFKDGKFKMDYYDDGNTFEPGSQYAPSIRARTLYFKNYFKERDGVMSANKQSILGLISVHESILNNSISVKTYFEKQEPKKKDW